MIKIGIICPSEIAFRRFLPALKKTDNFEYVGIATPNQGNWFEKIENQNSDIEKANYILSNEREKALQIIQTYGGKLFYSYESIIESEEIDALYIPLPPALHYKWTKLALLKGKHVLVEKPFTTECSDTEELIDIAKQNNLAVHENYMFAFHNQIQQINEIIESGEVGDVRLYKISFGFPQRDANDFRYNKELGGGALLDCGGYTIKYASFLLGETAKIVYAQSNYIDSFEVDMYGSGALKNANGMVVQITFGMDNDYKCELEVWGSKGTLINRRVLTAPDGFMPEILLRKGNSEEMRKLSVDDAFHKSIEHFQTCIKNTDERNTNYQQILKQAKLVDDFKVQANYK